jgi:inosine-uridine nucleoside N-ribohydrolase
MRTILLFLFCSISFHTVVAQEKRLIVLDADTANEVDDLFAITRALREPTWNVVALNATQWQVSQWAVPDTMEASHRLNMVLVGLLDQRQVKLYRGSPRRLFDWGSKQQHSEAASELIQLAKSLEPNQKIDVVALGALTNVASAILIDPSIADKINLYWLGSSYDFSKQSSKQIDFNCVMDIQAADVLFSSKVKMSVLPVNVASIFQVRFEDAKRELDGRGPTGHFLRKRWEEHYDSSQSKRVLWDLGLVEAMIRSDKATLVPVKGFENPNVMMFSEIESDDFWNDFVRCLD